MKYLKKFILFLLIKINLTYKNFNGFYSSLHDETDEIIESMESNYLSGLLNYSYDGCLDDRDAQQFLNEHGLFLDQYLSETNDNDLTILGLVDYVGY